MKWKYRFRYLAELLRKIPGAPLVYHLCVRDYDLNRMEIWREIEKIQHPHGYRPVSA